MRWSNQKLSKAKKKKKNRTDFTQKTAQNMAEKGGIDSIHDARPESQSAEWEEPPQ